MALAVDWNIRRCNIKGCTSRHVTTIVAGTEAGIFGLCEDHYKWIMDQGDVTVHLDLDFVPLGQPVTDA